MFVKMCWNCSNESLSALVNTEEAVVPAHSEHQGRTETPLISPELFPSEKKKKIISSSQFRERLPIFPLLEKSKQKFDAK